MVDDCQYCYPEKSYHTRRKIFSILDYFILYPSSRIFYALLFLSENDVRPSNVVMDNVVLKIFQKIKVFRKTPTIDRAQFSSSILALWDEAKSRGLEIYNFRESTSHTSKFLLVVEGKKYYYIETPINLVLQTTLSFDNDLQYDNKWIFKKKLLRHKIPCPLGRSFISSTKAYNYGIKLGYPLVVKPVSSSLSHHVFSNIQSSQELIEAIKLVKQIDCRVLVEQHIVGNVYRSIILNNILIACVMREPGNIVGDGVHTVGELIDIKNNSAWQEDLGRYLYRIDKSNFLLNTLSDQLLTLDTVLSEGEKIVLSEKMTRSCGAEISNVIDLIHPENQLLLETVHKILNIPLSGIDFICQNVAIPWNQQQFGIIENNSFPYIDLHHYPSVGEPVNVASKIWDYVLQNI